MSKKTQKPTGKEKTPETTDRSIIPNVPKGMLNRLPTKDQKPEKNKK